jgi:membrane protein YdbS with pleckstrin-like domain
MENLRVVVELLIFIWYLIMIFEIVVSKGRYHQCGWEVSDDEVSKVLVNI